jgi:hypothetical protein
MTRILIICLLLAACGHVQQESTPETQLASRIEHASTHLACLPEQTMAYDCLDDKGLVWSACAWNSCGKEISCRIDSQTAVASRSCGTPDWPPCPPR